MADQEDLAAQLRIGPDLSADAEVPEDGVVHRIIGGRGLQVAIVDIVAGKLSGEELRVVVESNEVGLVFVRVFLLLVLGMDVSEVEL